MRAADGSARGDPQRRSSFWQPEHEDGYAALEQAVELRELLASAELTVDSVAAGLEPLRGQLVADRHGLPALHLASAPLWPGASYGAGHPMGGESLREQFPASVWLIAGAIRCAAWMTGSARVLPAQRSFSATHVQPFLAKGQKVFVIISDALPLRGGGGICPATSFRQSVDGGSGCAIWLLPSYTQLGMASLLPGKQLAVDAATGNVTVDGQSATGTENRAEILSLACGGKATAIQAEDFLELNTKTDGRALMRDHEVIYIFHNVIDKIGDAAGTEAKTFDAVEQAFEELDLIIKKVANINGSNMLLTADHGFLFQQDDVDDRRYDAVCRQPTNGVSRSAVFHRQETLRPPPR